MTNQTPVKSLSPFEKVRRSLERLVNPIYLLKLYNDDDVAADLVITALSNTFSIDHSYAWSLMMQAHRKGQCVVFEGQKPDCDTYSERLRQYGLTVDVVPQS